MNQYVAIYGPPGTGKSTEVIRRFSKLLDDGVDPNRIGLVSFTKAAAKELANRIGIDTPNIATIHSYCYRLLGLTKQQVIGWSHLKEFEKVVGIEIRGDNPDEEEELCEGDIYLTLYGLAHARMTPYEETYDNSDQPGSRDRFIYFAQTYDNWKNAYGYVDFSDMLGGALDVPAPRLDWLFVDEAQDLSPLQWAVIRHWSGAISNITIAGDDDQAIYVWGGADPDGMYRFEQEYGAERVVLGQSYRVPQLAHRLAERVITLVSSRVDKEYLPRDEVGDIRHHSGPHSLRLEHGVDTLVLYRSHYMRREVEDYLIQRKIPYVTDSGRPGLMQGTIAASLRLMKKMRENIEHLGKPALTDAEFRILRRNMTHLAIAHVDAEKWDKLVERRPWDHLKLGGPWLAYLQAIEKNYGMEVKPTIHLSTIHGSKGRQAERVVLINDVSAKTASNMDNRDGFDAEMRTFYVGVTRTKNMLDIVHGDNALPVLMKPVHKDTE